MLINNKKCTQRHHLQWSLNHQQKLLNQTHFLRFHYLIAPVNFQKTKPDFVRSREQSNQFDRFKDAERETDLSRSRHFLSGKRSGFARFDVGLISLLLLKRLQWFSFEDFQISGEITVKLNFFEADLQATSCAFLIILGLIIGKYNILPNYLDPNTQAKQKQFLRTCRENLAHIRFLPTIVLNPV